MADYDVVVIGAGAAGMMCAAQAGQRGRRVAADRALSRARREDPHLRRRPLQLHQRRRRSARTISRRIRTFAARRWRAIRPRDFVRLVESYGIAYHEKKLGQLFCDDSAVDIIDMLKTECERGRVDWRDAVRGRWRARAKAIASSSRPRRAAARCASLVIATGGLTVPKIGATPFAYRIAEQFGLACGAAAAGAGAAGVRARGARALSATCPASRSTPK